MTEKRRVAGGASVDLALAIRPACGYKPLMASTLAALFRATTRLTGGRRI